MTNQPVQAEAPSDRDPSPVAAGAADHQTVFLALVQEMRGQRETLEKAQEQAARERKSEHRWRVAFQILVFGTPIFFGLVYFLFFLSSTGFRWGPFGDAVAVVRIEGEISSTQRASADNVIPALTKAFENGSIKAVVLSINSPGGAPVEAERISSSINNLRKKHPKPTIAVINDLGASAAFMIALHADKIIAGKYSLVGSIGAVMQPWQLDRAIAKLDVSQRVYASGKLKSFLNPYIPVTPEADAKAQHLVDQAGAAFLAEVKSLRGASLKSAADIGTGEVWFGSEAKDLGLIDQVSTLEAVVESTWGLRTYDFGPAQQSMPFFARLFQEAVVSGVQRLASTGPSIR